MLQPDKILYEAEVIATGGRDGKAAKRRRLLSVSLSLPKSLGCRADRGQSGAAVCRRLCRVFPRAVKLVARTRKITPSRSRPVTARSAWGRFRSATRFTVELKVLLPGLEKSVAEEVVAGAHERCLIQRNARQYRRQTDRALNGSPGTASEQNSIRTPYDRVVMGGSRDDSLCALLDRERAMVDRPCAEALVDGAGITPRDTTGFCVSSFTAGLDSGISLTQHFGPVCAMDRHHSARGASAVAHSAAPRGQCSG